MLSYLRITIISTTSNTTATTATATATATTAVSCRGITERIPMVVLNGDPERRYIGNLNFSFAYVEGESLLMVRIIIIMQYIIMYTQ